MKTLFIFLIAISSAYGQTMDDIFKTKMAEVVKEETINIEDMLHGIDSVVRKVVRKVLDEKFPAGVTPTNPIPVQGPTSTVPPLVTSSLLKITTPTNNQTVKPGEIITVRLDSKSVPGAIVSYKVYFANVLKDTDGSLYTPASFPVPGNLGTFEIRAEASTSTAVHTAKINIIVK